MKSIDVTMQLTAKTSGKAIYKHLTSLDIISSIVRNILILKGLKTHSWVLDNFWQLKAL